VGLVRRPHPRLADVLPQPPADLVVGHVRVEDDRRMSSSRACRSSPPRVPLVPEPAHELLIGGREHEEPDQLSAADLGEAPQLRKLIR